LLLRAGQTPREERTVKFARLVPIACLVLLWAATATTASAQAQPCEYKLGFKMIADQLPREVGGCLENEHYNPVNGDSLQRTANGLLVWRKLDNFTAFTDGYRTWVNGPFGIQRRLNTERFDWEAASPPAAPPPSAAAPTIDVSVDSATVAPGQCVTIRWNFVNVRSAFLLGAGMDTTQLPGNGERLVCPGATTTYTMNVVDVNGASHTRQLTVSVSGPSISFTADSTTIARGQCVTIRWNVNNIKSVYLRGPDVDTGVTGQGDRLVCPSGTATYRLDITDLNNNTVSPTVTINVQ
jgi:hypothetical protein